MKSKPTDEWASLLQEQLVSRENLPKGSGWSTTQELSKKLGLTEHAMKRRTMRLTRDGVVEMFRGTRISNGRLCNQTWYRIKKGKK